MAKNQSQPRLVQPTSFPEPIAAVFNELTGQRADEWALASGVALSRFRKRHSRSPTFAEFFDVVFAMPDLDAAKAVDWSEVPGAILYSLRHHIAVDWRRRGWISWSRMPRSLRQGATFGVASRQWRANLLVDRDA